MTTGGADGNLTVVGMQTPLALRASPPTHGAPFGLAPPGGSGWFGAAQGPLFTRISPGGHAEPFGPAGGFKCTGAQGPLFTRISPGGQVWVLPPGTTGKPGSPGRQAPSRNDSPGGQPNGRQEPSTKRRPGGQPIGAQSGMPGRQSGGRWQRGSPGGHGQPISPQRQGSPQAQPFPVQCGCLPGGQVETIRQNATPSTTAGSAPNGQGAPTWTGAQ